MYFLPYQDMKEAAQIIYRFITAPGLYGPECSLWNSAGLYDHITNNGARAINLEDLTKKMLTPGIVAVSCVASTDKADKRRCALNLIAGVNALVLSFPSADGKLNAAESKLLELLEN